MLASGNDHKYVAAAPIQSSICEVVKLAQTELQDLLTRREEITRRIRSIHQVVGGLEAVPSQPALGRSITKGFAVGSHTYTRDSSTQAYLNLRRACRIALMEAEGTASPKEIYCRIVPWDFFHLRHSECATQAFVGVLNAVTYDGEVRRWQNRQSFRWYSVLREDEASTPL
jgi:hypothetical protein